MKCPECHSTNIIEAGSDTICRGCGLVLNDYKYGNPLVITNCEDKSCGIKSKHYGEFVNHLSYADIRRTTFNVNGSLKNKGITKFHRIKKINELPYGIPRDLRLFAILHTIGRHLNISNVIIDTAGYYYKKINKEHKGKVINKISLIATCIFIASRENSHNTPISIKEICYAFNRFHHRVRPHLIFRDILEYSNIFNKIITNIRKPEDYMNKFINKITNINGFKERMNDKNAYIDINEYSSLLLNTSLKILKYIPKTKVMSRNPFILAASIIYMADIIIAHKNNHKKILTQKIISRATSVAEYSIRDHYINLLKGKFKAKT